ncbi:sulfotransferase family 2 domain-containing protein [Sulfitobacter sp. F26204]|uniref:sulfotransferase family 2 domain-containing protein n=1 Tax=Sulfitobacter sp. F26204 TaxID=2996014 RepID=UPI00225E66F3|nr:sulfotransferase family 2 domain-containing protein [Sulfitobacter sp. F26204]MCX7558202.1 sulfotransferase family 2 domain-containing protein [Sulfitobacter sp. F26204]
MRHIILHIHLFKNAGTSVDYILRQNFPGRWVTREFPDPHPDHTPDVAGWIRNNPEAVAFSSHTIQAPLPQIEGVHIVPIIMLRDPIDRIASAYRFERIQHAETRGTLLARQNGFAGYVHARLNTAGDRQCRNFQTSRLSALIHLAAQDELTRAKSVVTTLSETGILGLVVNFDTAMDRLAALIKPHYPSFVWHPVTANASNQRMATTVSPEMRRILEETNRDDFELLRFAQKTVAQACAGDCASTPKLAIQQSGI